MDETFELPVIYKGAAFAFTARLLQYGYTHKFAVAVHGQEIFFEPDEEQNYRALIDPEVLNKNKLLDVDLLKAIAQGIEAVT